MMTVVAAALGCIMATAIPAAAEPRASDLAGRWTLLTPDAKRSCAGEGCRLTLDIMPCGEAWCGVEVKDGKECGRTVLRLVAGSPSRVGAEFSGRYEKSDGSEPYVVNARLGLHTQKDLPNEQLLLSVWGHTGGTFQAFRRIFPLRLVLKREGEPACRGEPKVS